MLKTSRKLHKWLMLFLGVQFVIWSITGAYMVFLDIDYIHGNSLVINHQTKITPDKIQYSLKNLLKDYPLAEHINVGTFIDKNVYRFSTADQTHLIDAENGQLLSPLSKDMAQAAATHYYSGNGPILDFELLTEDPPFELTSRRLPAWRVNFDDFGSPSIYVSSQSGQLVGKRHEFWRIFDWMFRFHIMDYSDAEDIDNMLLFWVTLFSIVVCILGLVLVYFTVFKKNKKPKVTTSRSAIFSQGNNS